VAGTSHAAPVRTLASRSSAVVPGGRGMSGTASEARRLARGDYVPQSRDIRGIGTRYKITPEASSPMNKGPPPFAIRRSVKPSAQPTLVRTQHPPLENSQLLLEKFSHSPIGTEPQESGPQTVGSALPRALARSFANMFGTYICKSCQIEPVRFPRSSN
jgi:hypothetical protein